jgi:hypothetical protein
MSEGKGQANRIGDWDAGRAGGRGEAPDAGIKSTVRVLVPGKYRGKYVRPEGRADGAEWARLAFEQIVRLGVREKNNEPYLNA